MRTTRRPRLRGFAAPARPRVNAGVGRMRQSVASNLAVGLALLAWPLIVYGFMSQLGDYHPSTPSEVIAANRRTSVGVLLTGFLCFLGALWLSGFSFTGAKVRSLLAATCCTALVTFGVIGLWL